MCCSSYAVPVVTSSLRLCFRGLTDSEMSDVDKICGVSEMSNVNRTSNIRKIRR